MSYIVTRDTIKEMVSHQDPNRVAQVIGRALVVLLNNQTSAEQASNITHVHNNIGFTSSDAHSGCITAKYFIRHKRLKEWQIQAWTRVGKTGYPRIAKYWKQLNEAAVQKQSVNKG